MFHKKNTAYVQLGTNLGNRAENLSSAINLIAEICEILQISQIYQTEAWGVNEQPDYYNQVIEIQTTHTPEELMKRLLEIETKMGRLRHKKWAARNIDLDVLYFADLCLHTPSLTVPHPRLHERRFVLIPLAEIAPDFQHPILKQNTHELLKSCSDTLSVMLCQESNANNATHNSPKQ